jgi:hypothetical protein
MEDFGCENTINIFKKSGRLQGYNNVDLGRRQNSEYSALKEQFFNYESDVTLNNALMFIQSHKRHQFLKLWPSLLNIESFSLDVYHGLSDTLINIADLCSQNDVTYVHKVFYVRLRI